MRLLANNAQVTGQEIVHKVHCSAALRPDQVPAYRTCVLSACLAAFISIRTMQYESRSNC